MNEKMKRHNLIPQHLYTFIDQNLELEKLGFTHKTAEILAYELAKKGLDQQSTATKLTSILNQHGTLEDALPPLQTMKTRLEREIMTAGKR